MLPLVEHKGGDNSGRDSSFGQGIDKVFSLRIGLGARKVVAAPHHDLGVLEMNLCTIAADQV